MISILLALLQFAPPSPVASPPAPTPARDWTCDLTGPTGDHFRLAGDFDRVEVGSGAPFGTVSTSARISQGPKGEYVGAYKAAYNYGEPRTFGFAVSRDGYMTQFSYRLLKGQPGGLMIVTRQKQESRAPFEALGIGYCTEQMKG